jgi:hypothetical protein
MPILKMPEPIRIIKRHITVGAFFDRFGENKWSILSDTQPIVQALVKDASVRAWINLDDPQLQIGLQLLKDAGHDINIDDILQRAILPEERP